MTWLSLYIDDKGRTALHRSGFSWLAAVAIPLWALHRRLWWVFLASLPLTILLHGTADTLISLLPGEKAQGVAALAWLLGWSLIAGFLANHVHRRLLERSGYRMTATEAPAQAAA